MSVDPLLWTSEQAGKSLGVSAETMRSWRDSERGPLFVKLGRLVRYRPADVADFVASLPYAQPGTYRVEGAEA